MAEGLEREESVAEMNRRRREKLDNIEKRVKNIEKKIKNIEKKIKE